LNKIKSINGLKEIKEQALKDAGEAKRALLRVGMATCGIAAGGRAVMDALKDEISKQKLKDVSVIPTGCIGMCYAEPIVEVEIPGKGLIRYGNVDEARAREIINKHVIQGALADNVITGGDEDQSNIENQVRIALRNCGVINPEKIEDYIAQDGYGALGKILTELKPEEVVDIMKKKRLARQGRRRFPHRYKMGSHP